MTPPARPGVAAGYAILVGLVGLAALAQRLWAHPEEILWLPALVFILLSLLVQRASFHLGSPAAHSLVGIIDLAAVLALGPTTGALVAAVSGPAYLECHAIRRRQFARRDLLEIPLHDAGLKALLALLAGAVYAAWAGPLPARISSPQAALVVAAICLLWFLVDRASWAAWNLLDGGHGQLVAFARDSLARGMWIQLLPLPFGALLALVFTHLGWTAFGLMATGIVAVAFLAQRWSNAQEALVQRVAEISTIEEVSRAIAQAELDVDSLCQLMYEHTSRLVDSTIFHLGLFEGDDYTLKLWMRNGQSEPERTFPMVPGTGLVNWLRSSGQPLLVHDFAKEMDSLPARPTYIADKPPRSGIFVPLMAGEAVIGAMSVQSYRADAYGESDTRILSAMANQAAVAIQKAQLYAQEHKRVRQLETIGQVSRQITAILDLDDLFGRLVQIIRESFGYYHVAIYTAVPEQQYLIHQASASAGATQVAVDAAWGQGLVGWVAANGQSAMANDVAKDPRYRSVEALDETRAELAVPLLLEGLPVGVLDVQSDSPAAFGPDDLFVLETLGDQMAIAIHEAHLYEAERQQAWLATVLLQVADSMSQIADMDAVLTTIVRLTPMLAGVERCAILLWMPDTESFVPAQSHGFAAGLTENLGGPSFSAAAVPALDLIRWDKSPLVINTLQDSLLLPSDIVHAFQIEQMVLLPLLAQGELLGVMAVDSPGGSGARSRGFSERTVEMLTGIANQAATVIKSASLVAAQKEESYVSAALLQVAEAVSRSASLEDALAGVVRITPMLTGVERCALFLWDPASSVFVPYQQYGLGKDLLPTFWQMHLAAEDPIALSFQAGTASLLPDSATSCLPAGLTAAGFTLVSLPLASRGDLLGGMIVDFTGPRQRLTGRWLDILTGIADQAAIAIENDRLLQAKADQERIKQELDVARRIQASLLPEGGPDIPGWDVAAIWRSARQVSGDFYDFVPLPSGEAGARAQTGVVIGDVADKGVPAALFVSLARTLMRTVAREGHSPGEAVSHVNDLILADARGGLFVTLIYAVLQSDSDSVSYVNAGHLPPLLVRAGSREVEELWTHDPALAILPEIEYEQQAIVMEPGDALVLYTDGVSEASDAEQQMFGRERLRQVIARHRALSAGELAEAILAAVDAFAGDAPQFDDLTLVVAKRRAE